MWKRRTVLVAAACLVAAVALIAVLCRSNEPCFKDHSLTYWTTHYEDLRDGGPETQGIQAIAHMGTNALPFLLEWIDYNPAPSRFRGATKSILARLPATLVPETVATWANDDLKDSRAAGAIWAFAALGPQAQRALPQLFRRMNAPGATTNASGIRAFFALYHTPSDDMVPHYLAHLANTNAPNRPAVAALIGQCPLATNTEQTIMALVPHLGDDNARLRQDAADALACQVTRHAFLVSHLTNSFAASTNSLVRAGIVWVFCRVGQQEANAAYPLLLAALHDQDPALRLQTAKLIPLFDPKAADALPLLTNLLGDAIVHDAASNAIQALTKNTRTNAPLPD